MTCLMAGSISIVNLDKLSKRIIKDARALDYNGLEGNPTSHMFRDFFIHAESRQRESRIKVS